MKATEIFEKVKAHLLEQGEKSMTEVPNMLAGGTTYGCAYRGVEGRMCAVGCLIPDTHYDPKMEGVGVNGLVSGDRVGVQAGSIRFPQLGFLRPHVRLLTALQNAHDSKEPEFWAEELDEIERRLLRGEYDES